VIDFNSEILWRSLFGIVIFTFIGNFLTKKFAEQGVPSFRFGGYVCYAVAAGYAAYLLVRFVTG